MINETPDTLSTQTPPMDSHESSLSSNQKEKNHKKAPVRRIVLISAALLVMLGLVGGMTWMVYRKPPTDSVVRKIVTVLPYPALKLNDTTLTIADYLVEYDALISFFDSFEDTQEVERPSEEELEQNIIDTMLNKTAIEQLAVKYGVAVSSEDVEAMMQEVMTESGSQDEFATQIQETFGWSVDEFKEHVVRPIVLATKMSEYVGGNQEIQKEKREQIDAAADRLSRGEEFSVVASETNDDRSAIFGGDLGYVLLSDLPEEWLPAVEALEIGEYSEVIETIDGYSILSLTDRITAGEDEQVQLSAILVRKLTIEVLVDSYLEDAIVKRYIGKTE